jgi:hypothetical protein
MQCQYSGLSACFVRTHQSKLDTPLQTPVDFGWLCFRAIPQPENPNIKL